MGLQKEIKLMRLMQDWPQGTVITTAWAEQIGISRQLLKRYQDSGWIERLGRGAYKKPGDNKRMLYLHYKKRDFLKLL